MPPDLPGPFQAGNPADLLRGGLGLVIGGETRPCDPPQGVHEQRLCALGVRNRCAAGPADIKAGPADINACRKSGQCRGCGKHDTDQYDEYSG